MTNSHQINLGMASTQAADLRKWALPQLRAILPLDDASLNETLDYALTLQSSEATADHWRGLLGEDGSSLDFISGFSLRFSRLLEETRPKTNGGGSPASGLDHVPASRKKAPKKQQGLSTYAQGARHANEGTIGQGEQPEGSFRAYRKEDYQNDFLGTKTPTSKPSSGTSTPQKRRSRLADSLAISDPIADASSDSQTKTAAAPNLSAELASASPSGSQSAPPTKLPPSAHGPLISDSHVPKPQKKSKKPGSHAAHRPAATLKFTGGRQMHAPAAQLSDIDLTIRALELQTQLPSKSKPKPSASSDGTEDGTSSAEQQQKANDAARFCNCMATRHPLLTAVPNCLNCGQIICIKQGLGPCVSCHAPLLSQSDLQSTLQVLREERGKERMSAHNASQTGPSSTPTSNSNSKTNTPRSGSPSITTQRNLSAARAHKDKLLTYQSQTTLRTTIHDEAADFDATPVGGSGGNRWLDPRERALAIRKQERLLAAQEWNARPEYEKRRVVVGFEIGDGGRVRAGRRMEGVVGPGDEGYEGVDEYGDADGEEDGDGDGVKDKGKGRETEVVKREMHANPFGKRLIKPVWRPPEGVEPGDEEERRAERDRRRKAWRRVQDDLDDDEAQEQDVLLDGGMEGADRLAKDAASSQPP